ncbi:disks large homolog 1-like [Scyliorhinus canicula]|uniref:disks large homolog 1-like n=1 Tax=Scyliorhinus canicula TaxID=7830 RepID=UPI0018F67FEB|nr:disks large homolog 1-like [Scyliorhinus canicula]
MDLSRINTGKHFRAIAICKQDTRRVGGLMEEGQTKLDPAQDDRFKARTERLLAIFQSDLFQALLDIQQFYEESLKNQPASPSLMNWPLKVGRYLW